MNRFRTRFASKLKLCSGDRETETSFVSLERSISSGSVIRQKDSFQSAGFGSLKKVDLKKSYGRYMAMRFVCLSVYFLHKIELVTFIIRRDMILPCELRRFNMRKHFMDIWMWYLWIA